MDKKMSKKKRPQGVVAGGPGGSAMVPGESAKDFKGTLKKTVKYMRKDLVIIIIAFVLAIGGVIATLVVPEFLGDATDELISGTTANAIYKSTEAELNMINRTDEEIAFLQAIVDSSGDDITFIQAKNMGLLGDMQVPSSFKEVKISTLIKLNECNTFGELFTAMIDEQMMQPEIINQIPTSYREKVLSYSFRTEPKADIATIVKILVNILILVGISGVLAYAQGFLLAGVAQRVSYRFRKDIYNKIDKLPLKYYDDTSTGEVMSYLTNDVDSISTALNQSLSQIITTVTTMLGVMIMMFRINWILTLVTLLIIPFSLLAMMLIIKRSQKYYVQQQEYLGHVNGHVEEMFGGHNVIKLFNGEKESKEVFAKQNDQLYSSAWNSQFISGTMMPLMKLMGNISYVVICVLGGYMVVNTSMMSVGGIQAFIQYSRQFNQPISQIAGIANTFQSTVAAAERVFNFIESDEEKETGNIALETCEGNVEFDHVRFGYNEDKIIINDFSCSVKKGDRVAIVGPTGAGKTTIVKLLMRYYDLNGGSIKLDGIDITDMTRNTLRSHIGMVLQDTWLYTGTIMDNIRYGNLSASDEDVIRASKIACSDHFINTLPGGYNFVLNEDADNISQGQKQLLTIARAVLANPSVLILDEATSSVDTRTEMLIQKAMDRLMEGRTSFIIAHRLSTIKNADKILVLKDGDVVESGTHNELLELDGFYAKLYNSQFEA